jgi:hypothetical protein
MRAAAWVLAGTLAILAADDRGVPDVGACRSMVLVAPRDGSRLTVEADGSARINYAALPQTARVGRGTFEFHKLHAQLAAGVEPERGRDCAGTVEFVTSRAYSESVAWCLTDEGLAADQFEWAWAHVQADGLDLEGEHLQTLRQMWGKRASPRRTRPKARASETRPLTSD